ncbi:MAG TPA: signal peptidase II [Gemmatimonadaceae bacterium]|nr:signal peptidase II [Gemmatimonadaceae bacterium]
MSRVTVTPVRAHRSPRFWAIVCGALLLDWMVKWWAVRTMAPGVPWPSSSAFATLVLVSNHALFYGLTLPGFTPRLYAVLGLAVVGWLFWLSSRIPARANGYVAAFGLVIGGAAGNKLEQGLFGAATDFISFGMGVFNLADVFAFAGAALYLWLRLRDGVREEGWKRTLAVTPLRPVDRTLLPPSLRDS